MNLEASDYSKMERAGLDEVIPGVYIGSYAAACDADTLISAGVTHILTAAEGLEPAFPTVHPTQRFTYKLLPLLDTADCRVRPLLSEALE